MSRCKCLVHYSSGEVVRCSRMTPEDTKYCYHHEKYFKFDDYYPSTDDWRKYTSFDNDYIEFVSDLDGSDVRTFDYEERRTPSLY